MKNTDYNLGFLSSVISSDSSLKILNDIISDLGLEIEDIEEV